MANKLSNYYTIQDPTTKDTKSVVTLDYIYHADVNENRLCIHWIPYASKNNFSHSECISFNDYKSAVSELDKLKTQLINYSLRSNN